MPWMLNHNPHEGDHEEEGRFYVGEIIYQNFGLQSTFTSVSIFYRNRPLKKEILMTLLLYCSCLVQRIYIKA